MSESNTREDVESMALSGDTEDKIPSFRSSVSGLTGDSRLSNLTVPRSLNRTRTTNSTSTNKSLAGDNDIRDISIDKANAGNGCMEPSIEANDTSTNRATISLRDLSILTNTISVPGTVYANGSGCENVSQLLVIEHAEPVSSSSLFTTLADENNEAVIVATQWIPPRPLPRQKGTPDPAPEKNKNKNKDHRHHRRMHRPERASVPPDSAVPVKQSTDPHDIDLLHKYRNALVFALVLVIGGTITIVVVYITHINKTQSQQMPLNCHSDCYEFPGRLCDCYCYHPDNVKYFRCENNRNYRPLGDEDSSNHTKQQAVDNNATNDVNGTNVDDVLCLDYCYNTTNTHNIYNNTWNPWNCHATCYDQLQNFTTHFRAYLHQYSNQTSIPPPNDKNTNIFDLDTDDDDDDNRNIFRHCEDFCYLQNIHRDWDPYICDIPCYTKYRQYFKRYALWLQWMIDDFDMDEDEDHAT